MLKTKIIKIDPKDIDIKKIETAAKILKEGGLVAYPTDTVYGLAANYYDKRAVERIYEIKKRPKDKPLTIQIDTPERLKEFNIEITEDARVLIDKFWPGPLTLILKTKNQKRIGFRIPDHKIAKSLLETAQVPLCVPSANFSADTPSKDAHSVIISFDGLVEAIIDGSSCPGGVESTVLDLTSYPYRVLREAAVSLKELENCFTNKEKFIKVKDILFVCTGNSCRSVMAKGFLLKEIVSSTHLSIESAGTGALTGLPPTKETIEVMAEEGIDISGERGQNVSATLIKKADLILVMEPKHKQYILEKYPASEGKVYLIKEYKNERDVKEPYIKDPIGQSMSVYKEVLDEIKKEIKRIKDLI